MPVECDVVLQLTQRNEMLQNSFRNLFIIIKNLFMKRSSNIYKVTFICGVVGGSYRYLLEFIIILFRCSLETGFRSILNHKMVAVTSQLEIQLRNEESGEFFLAWINNVKPKFPSISKNEFSRYY